MFNATWYFINLFLTLDDLIYDIKSYVSEPPDPDPYSYPFMLAVVDVAKLVYIYLPPSRDIRRCWANTPGMNTLSSDQDLVEQPIMKMLGHTA